MALEWKVNKVMGSLYAETRVGTYWVHSEGSFSSVQFIPSGMNERLSIGWRETREAAKVVAEDHYFRRVP